MFSLFSFCSHGDRFRERLEWQHSPSGHEEIRMIIPLTHLMWFSLNLSVFGHLFHYIIFSKIEKNIYNWFSWIIIVTNYVKYIKWHVILLCYFELLTYFFLWHHHIDRIINLEHYITLLMLLSCTALTFLYFCIFRSWNSNPYSPHVLITVNHSKPCWYLFEPILWTCTTNWTQINKLAVLSQLLNHNLVIWFFVH